MSQCEQIGRRSLPIFYTKKDYISFFRNDPTFSLIVALEDNRVIGFVVINLQPVDRIHIMSLAIDSEHRRKGIASKLVDYLKRENKNISLYVQTVNESAVSFYIINGFKTLAELDDYYGNLDSPKAYFMVFLSK